MEILRGKLFIKYIHSKIIFYIKQYKIGISYNRYLRYTDKLGLMQAPLVSKRLISIMELLFNDTYVLSSITLMPDYFGFQKTIDEYIKNKKQKSYKNYILKKLLCLDGKALIEIRNVNLISYSKESEISLLSNGIIKIDKDHYDDITKKIVRFLDSHEK